eukprot:767230-Hanusia_phi.AAC.3
MERLTCEGWRMFVGRRLDDRQGQLLGIQCPILLLRLSFLLHLLMALKGSDSVRKRMGLVWHNGLEGNAALVHLDCTRSPRSVAGKGDSHRKVIASCRSVNGNFLPLRVHLHRWISDDIRRERKVTKSCCSCMMFTADDLLRAAAGPYGRCRRARHGPRACIIESPRGDGFGIGLSTEYRVRSPYPDDQSLCAPRADPTGGPGPTVRGSRGIVPASLRVTGYFPGRAAAARHCRLR